MLLLILFYSIITNSVFMSISNTGPFHAPNMEPKSNISGLNESYKASLISKDRLNLKKIILKA